MQSVYWIGYLYSAGEYQASLITNHIQCIYIYSHLYSMSLCLGLWIRFLRVYLTKFNFHHTGCIHITWASSGSCCWSIRLDVIVRSNVCSIRCQNSTGNFMLYLIMMSALDGSNYFTNCESSRKYLNLDNGIKKSS